MLSARRIFIKFFLLCLLLSFSSLRSQAGEPFIPAALQKERARFLENQIFPEIKQFLDEFSRTNAGIAKLNASTCQVYRAIPSTEADAAVSIARVTKASRKAYAKLVCRSCPKNTIASFLKASLPQDTALEKQLAYTLAAYDDCIYLEKRISDFSRQSSSSAGSYYYLNIRTESFKQTFGESLPEVLNNSVDIFTRLSKIAADHDISRLSALMEQHNQYFLSARDALDNEIIQHLQLTNQTVVTATMVSVFKLIRIQLEFNHLAIEAFKVKLSEIPNPVEPRLPDLSVPSIELLYEDTARPSQKITIIALVKNNGELLAPAHTAEIFFPDGSSKNYRIGQLDGGKSQKITATYTVKTAGENIFMVGVNSDRLAFEENYENNFTRRGLVLPAQ